VDFGVVLLAFGGFLIGGAWSVWRGGEEREQRSALRVAVAVILLIAALLATASGILRLV
jgi:cytochrome bd-type quinol oxidase subunit 1